MATLNKGQTFGVTETVTNTKLHNLVDLATISAILNADIDNNAAIADTKLATISTSGKVNAIAISNLASIPAGSGVIPQANLPDTITDFSTLAVSSLASISLLNVENLVPANASIPCSQLYNLASLPSAELFNYNNVVSSLASGSMPMYNGANNFVGGKASTTSNVIFSWSGVETANYSTAQYGLYMGDNSLETAAAVGQIFNSFLYNKTDTFRTLLEFKFKKISGISTVAIYAKIGSGSASHNAILNVDIGGQSNVVQTTGTSGWATPSNIDVSGLTNGTAYNGIIQLKNYTDGIAARCYAVTLIGG